MIYVKFIWNWEECENFDYKCLFGFFVRWVNNLIIGINIVYFKIKYMYY